MLFEKKLSFFVILLMAFSFPYLKAQKPGYPVDSSYTVDISYWKALKNYPGITMATNSAEQSIYWVNNVIYKFLRNRQLHLDIYRTKDTSANLHPVVLLIHGGGWSSGTKSHMEVIARDLAFSGYVAVAVEYRLSPEAKYPAGLEDLHDAIRWMAEYGAEFQADGNRVVVLGASSGAQMASFLGTTENDQLPFKAQISSRIKGIVNIDGIVSFVHSEASYEGDAASRWLGGTRETHWDNWTAASPLEYVDEQSPPILFINGSSPRFHAGRDSLRTLYAQYGIYNEVFEFADAPHTFWFFQPWYTPMMYKILHFLGNVF